MSFVGARKATVGRGGYDQKAGTCDEVRDLRCRRDWVAEAAWRRWPLEINMSRNCKARGWQSQPRVTGVPQEDGRIERKVGSQELKASVQEFGRR